MTKEELKAIRKKSQDAMEARLLEGRKPEDDLVAAGYGGDIDTDTAYGLLDDMNFNRYGKWCVRRLNECFLC